MNQNQIERKIKYLEKRLEKKEKLAFKRSYLRKIEAEILLLKKMKAKYLYTSSILIFSEGKIKSAVSYGPAISSLDNGTRVYKPTWTSPREVNFTN